MKKLLLILLILTGCTPYIDYRHEPNTKGVGTASPNRAAVCFNSWFTNQKEVNDLAIEHCAKTQREPVFDDRDRWACSLFYPQRAYYKCVENPELTIYDLNENQIALRRKEQEEEEKKKETPETLW